MKREAKRGLFVAAMSAIALSGASCGSSPAVAHPRAMGYTHAVPLNQVQDAAIWVHPTNPAASLVLVTNEGRGLEVHDPEGVVLKHLDDGIKPKYVDVAYGFPLREGGKVMPTDLAVVSCIGTVPPGVRVYAIDPARSKLRNVTAGPAIPAFAGKGGEAGNPLGLLTYRSAKTGKHYAIVTPDAAEDAAAEQYELVAREDGTVTGKLVRSIPLPDKSKGGVADNEAGVIYLACEKKGIFAFDAEPDGGVEGRCVIPVNDHGLVPHVRGPALVATGKTTGYLLVLSQGSKPGKPVLNVYDRQPPYRFRATIDPKTDSPVQGWPADALNHTSGMDVTAKSMGPAFPGGMLLLNDQHTPSGNEEFKLYRWDEVAREAGLR